MSSNCIMHYSTDKFSRWSYDVKSFIRSILCYSFIWTILFWDLGMSWQRLKRRNFQPKILVYFLETDPNEKVVIFWSKYLDIIKRVHGWEMISWLSDDLSMFSWIFSTDGLKWVVFVWHIEDYNNIIILSYINLN